MLLALCYHVRMARSARSSRRSPVSTTSEMTMTDDDCQCWITHMKIWHRPAITVTSEGKEKNDRNERTCKNIFHDREVMRDARHACVATCLDSTQTHDMYVTHEPYTSASDVYTHAYPACAAGVPGDLLESRHHAARCAAVGDATHRADCLVLYLVPWCLVWG